MRSSTACGTEVHFAVDRHPVGGVEAGFGGSRQLFRQLEFISHVSKIPPCA
jgi:hypothetical protein